MATERERNRGLGAYSSPGVDKPFDQAHAFETAATAPIVSWSFKNLQPPSQLYVTTDDTLFLIIKNSFANQLVRLWGRILTTEGVIVPFRYDLSPTSDRSTNNFAFPLPEGFLLSVVASDSGSPIRGQTWLSCGLIKGTFINGVRRAILFQDYLNIDGFIGWPGGLIRHAVEGAGFIRSIVGTTPAAGADINEAVPTSARWEVISGVLTLTTSAVVATRTVILAFKDNGGNVIWRSPATTTQLASSTIRYTFSQVNVNNAVAATEDQLVVPPDNRLMAGWLLITGTTNLQAGDQWAAPVYSVQEWIED